MRKPLILFVVITQTLLGCSETAIQTIVTAPVALTQGHGDAYESYKGDLGVKH